MADARGDKPAAERARHDLDMAKRRFGIDARAQLEQVGHERIAPRASQFRAVADEQRVWGNVAPGSAADIVIGDALRSATADPKEGGRVTQEALIAQPGDAAGLVARDLQRLNEAQRKPGARPLTPDTVATYQAELDRRLPGRADLRRRVGEGVDLFNSGSVPDSRFGQIRPGQDRPLGGNPQPAAETAWAGRTKDDLRAFTFQIDADRHSAGGLPNSLGRDEPVGATAARGRTERGIRAELAESPGLQDTRSPEIAGMLARANGERADTRDMYQAALLRQLETLAGQPASGLAPGDDPTWAARTEADMKAYRYAVSMDQSKANPPLRAAGEDESIGVTAARSRVQRGIHDELAGLPATDAARSAKVGDMLTRIGGEAPGARDMYQAAMLRRLAEPEPGPSDQAAAPRP